MVDELRHPNAVVVLGDNFGKQIKAERTRNSSVRMGVWWREF